MPDDNAKPTFRERIQRGLSSGKEKIVKAVKAVAEAAQGDFFALFKGEENATEIAFPIDMVGDTVWATQAQMAELFGVNVPAISKHISGVYDDAELTREATVSKLETVRSEGGREVRREVDHYNLDMILAVGYRVSGKRATEFRKWASRVLKGYIQNGYALNGARLNSDPAALLKLSQEVRALRTSEKNIYDQVRETFKLCSIDYDSKSDECRRFFATSQDKFHFAISEHTSAQIILSRADGTKPNMGMTSIGNSYPCMDLAKVAKNYLTSSELRSLEILGEQWLLYAEGMAQRNKAVSMARLLQKLDDIIVLNEYNVFPGYEAIGAKRNAAEQHAREQLEIYKKANPKRLH